MKVLLIILGVIIAIIVIFILLLFSLLLFGSAKYETIWEKTENGWKQQSVMHSCGEPIDEEFIKLWHDREREYKEWRKKNK